MAVKKSVISVATLLMSILSCFLTITTSLGSINTHIVILVFKIILLVTSIIVLLYLIISQTKNSIVNIIICVTSLVLIITSICMPLLQIPNYYKKAITVSKIHSNELYNDQYVYNPNQLYHGAKLYYWNQSMIYGGIDGQEDVLFISFNTERKVNGIYYYDGYLYSEDDISEAETYMHGPVEMIKITDSWYKVVVELSA